MLDRRQLLAGVSVGALSLGLPKAKAWTHGTTAVAPLAKADLVVNLAEMTYYTGANGLLNWARVAEGLNDVDNTGNLNISQSFLKGYRDTSTGELKPGAGLTNFISTSYGFFTTPVNYPLSPTQGPGTRGQTPWWKSQQWDISWTGTATASISGSLGTGGTSSFGANSGTVTFGTTDPNNVAVVFTLTNVSDPPKNVKITLHEYTSLLGTTDWDPRFIAECSNWGVLRAMDWSGVNNGGAPSFAQLADSSYILANSQFGGISNLVASVDNGSGGAGNTLTVTSNSAGLAVGYRITSGNHATIGTVTALGTGTGGNGTYTIDGAPQLIASKGMGGEIPANSTIAYGGSGFKGGVHPSVLADLAVRSNCHIWFNIPVYMSNTEVANIANYFANHAGMRTARLQVWYEVGNELWNNFQCNFWCRSQDLPFGSSQPVEWGSYRAAQMMQQVYNTYGAANRTRWRGIIGGQAADYSVIASAALPGINYYLANEAPVGTKITDLFDAGAIAPYIGPTLVTENAQTIASITPGSTTTINYSAAHGYTSAQFKRFFVSAGTGASSLNNLDKAVTVTSSTALTVAVNSTGLTFSGTMFSCEPALFDILDASIANNISTPASYPSKYTYFTQQLAKALMTGSSDAQVHGTWSAQGTDIAASLPQVQLNALTLNSNGLQLVNYEGGYNMNAFAPLTTQNQPGGVADFLMNWVFDSTTPIDANYNVAKMYAQAYGLQRQVWSQYPSRFSDNQPAAIDAWCSLRFFGDEANPTYQAMLTQAALTPYVDPVSPVFGGVATYPGNATNYLNSQSGASPATDTLSTAVIGTAATKVFVLVANTGGTTNSVTIDPAGANIAATQVVGSSGQTSIWVASVGAGANVRTVQVVTTGGGFQSRSFYVLTVSGLSSTTPIASSVVASNATTMNIIKGQLILTVGRTTGASTGYGNTSGVSQGVTQTLFSDTSVAATNACVMAGLVSPFSSTIFSVNQGAAGTIAAATFR